MEIERVGCGCWSGLVARGAVVGRSWVRRMGRVRDAMRIRGSDILLFCLFQVLYEENRLNM